MKGMTGLMWGMVVATLVAGSGTAKAQPSKPDLPQIAGRLDLTASGAGRWLNVLGVTPDKQSSERLLAISAAGETVATRDGGESSVSEAELDARLLRAGDAVILVHNHPGNAGLSANYFAQLAKPGVAAVVAIAHDGDMAVRGARYDPVHFEQQQDHVARVEIKKRLRVECGTGTLSAAASDAHFSHLAALALSKAGVIEYRAVLSSRPGLHSKPRAWRSARSRLAPLRRLGPVTDSPAESEQRVQPAESRQNGRNRRWWL